MSKFWTWILIILFLGATGVAGWSYYEKKSCEKALRSTEVIEEAIEECEEELETFTGEEVKISFDYPASWGEATETVINADDDTEDVVVEGKTFEISFADNPFLTISGASPDFEAGGIGGPCPIREFFNGENEDYQCAGREDTSGEVVACEEITVDEESGFTYYYLPNEACVGIEKVIFLPIDDDTFPGMVMEMRIVWEDDLNIVYLSARITASSRTNTSLFADSLNEILQNIEDALISGDYAYLAKLQIDQIDALVESIEYLE